MRRTPKNEALFEVVTGVLNTFFRLRALGMRQGTVTAGGGGVWGLLRTLEQEGPRTVPQIARVRPVARQHIQKLANELAREGLIEFVRNPDHRRSRLLRLTPLGEERLKELNRKVLDMTNVLGQDMDETELRIAARVLDRLYDRLGEHLELP